MQAVARTVWLMAASYDITHNFVHISGVNNKRADILSRVFQSAENLKCVFRNILVILSGGR